VPSAFCGVLITRALGDSDSKTLDYIYSAFYGGGPCDPTINLHDWFVGLRNGRVETLWPITARGASA